MRITVLTSNKKRHNYLINRLSYISSKLHIIQECATIFPGINPGRNKQSKIMKKYFSKVEKAQSHFFAKHSYLKLNKNCELLNLQMGDINSIKLKNYKSFFQSDLYIVFGTSFVKGKILNFLKKNKAINIHMGLSPYYRGTDCNFWALYDNNREMVGATTHYISEILDGGKILYTTETLKNKNSYRFTMSAVKLAIDELIKKIKNKSIFKIIPVKQNKILEIRYSKKKDFNDKIVNNFLKKNL